MKKLTIALIILCIATASVAQSNTRRNTKENVGTGLGALIGGVLGSKAGKGSGKIAAVVIGTVAGGVIGKQIGQRLDEQDAQKFTAATVEAANTGTPQTIVSPTSGATMVARAEPAPALQNTAEGVPPAECKIVQQSITLQNGDRQEDAVKLCRSNGTWELVDA